MTPTVSLPMTPATLQCFEQVSKGIQAQRLETRIQSLSNILEVGQPPYTRRAFSPAHAQGRTWLTQQFEEANLRVFVDAGGNLIGEHAPKAAPKQAKPIISGSHSDTVPGGGRYDGMAGILCALEAAQALHENGVQLAIPLWVTDFLAEEPGPFGVSCIGSRCIAGTLSDDMLKNTNLQGETLAEAIERVGGNARQIEQGPIHGTDPFYACLEMHIEQGPVLEQNRCAIGVVNGVVGICRWMVHVAGQADHAGTTPMHLRRDALASAAHVIAQLHNQARAQHAARGIVSTVGQLQVEPGGSNVVPSAVHFSLDVRAPTLQDAFDFWHRIHAQVQPQLDAWNTTMQFEEISQVQHATFPSQVQAVVKNAVKAANLTHHSMPSGAGHDAMHISPLCPTGMVFIPCKAGRSHAAEEYASPQALADGARVLLGSWLQWSHMWEQTAPKS